MNRFWKLRGAAALWALGLVVIAAQAAAVPSEPMMPRTVDGGVEFAIKAPGAPGAYVVGTFNDWGSNEDGVIRNEEFAMGNPDNAGVFRKTLSLAPGVYHFRYVLKDQWTEWISLPATQTPIDRDGNSILVVNPDGTCVPAAHPYVFPPRIAREGVQFRVYSPDSKTAEVVGTFNNWGKGQPGIANASGLMYPGTNYEFVRTIPLSAGTYAYGVRLDENAMWLPGALELPADEQGERYFTITGRNTIVELTDQILLPPRVVPGGVEFRAYAPKTEIIYVAGDFNNWGENDSGRVTDAHARMVPDARGMFVKVLAIEPGEYHFKYVINGHPDGWQAVDQIDLPQDKDGNSVFTLTADGKIKELAGKPDPLIETGVMALIGEDAREMAELEMMPPTPVQGGVLFQVKARKSAKVFVAGDFNNWANNDNGYISGSDALLRWDDRKSLFERTFPLTAGMYRFKYVYDGAWMAVDPTILPRDQEGNSVFTLTADGKIEELNRAGNSNEVATANTPAATPAPRIERTATEAETFSRNLERVMDDESKPRVLYFHHPDLASCAGVNEWLDSLAGQRFQERITMLVTDVSKHPSTAKRYGVYRIPAAVLLDDSGAVKEKIQYNDDDTRFVFELKHLAGVSVKSGAE
ncbi:hypothetical protein KQI84_08555 [bacterium]|nr:hypothetical protein [bacterium]